MKNNLLNFFGLLSVVAFTLLAGCATLSPGSDVLVVRTEQLETAAASFDLVVKVDHADRGFWRTNAPAFHEFAEWLRTPIPIDYQTNVMRRGLLMIKKVNDAKIVYKANAGTSNALLTAFADLRAAADQAAAWATIVKTPTH